jgi:hypothetical protein
MISVELHSRSMDTTGPVDGNRGDESQGETGVDGDDADGRRFLVSVYRKYVGEPESRREVYLGFGTFFAGVGMGVVALVLFLYSATQPVGTDLYWAAREAALAFGLLALPAVGTSVAVLLPVGRRTMGATAVGAGICVVAVVWLVQVYPYDWSGEMDVTVISVYAVGLVFLVAATGSALVAQYLERMSPEAGAAASADEADDGGEAVTDEQVATDIEEAMSDSELTWGGVEREPTTKRLKLNTPDIAEDQPADRTNVTPTEVRSPGEDVDDAVDGLRGLQGGQRETTRTDSPDEAVDALTEFRERQAEDADIETGVEPDRRPLGRLVATARHLLRRLRERLSR